MWKVVKEGKLGNLETPKFRKLQTSSHAKAKAESEHSRLGELAQEYNR